MITTTLNRIAVHSPCSSGWRTLLKHLGKTEADDEPLPYAVIVESNGLDDVLWACRCEPQYAREWRRYAIWCARQVQHLMTDACSMAVLDVAERFVNGQATRKELDARAAAWAAAQDARAAAWAAGAAAQDARAAAWAAEAAAWAAQDAAWAAAEGAAGAAARAAQREEFLRIVTNEVCR